MISENKIANLKLTFSVNYIAASLEFRFQFLISNLCAASRPCLFAVAKGRADLHPLQVVLAFPHANKSVSCAFYVGMTLQGSAHPVLCRHRFRCPGRF